jgi:hypothetical protein
MNGQINWWERRSVAVILVLTMAIPLVWPPIAPLVDLPGHMGRYAVQLAGPDSPLNQWYRFEWRPIGNLGVDLLIEILSPVFGIELGVKLIVIAIPVLSAAALLWIAHEVHGRVPPTTFFALPLVLGHPFLFGFVNFSLSMAFALLGFALWLRLGRLGKLGLRAMLFLAIAPLVWVSHTFGWGMLGLLCFSAELIRQHDLQKRWPRAFANAVFHCLVLAPPLIPMLVWRAASVDPSAATGDWFNWTAKFLWLNMTLRDRWRLLDGLSVGLIAMLIIVAIRDPRLAFSRNLAASALVLLAVYLLLPRIIFGSAYADMRLTPWLFAIALVAIRPGARATPKFLSAIAIIGIVFVAARVAATTASLGIASARYERALAALQHIPVGARVANFTQRACGMTWSTNRMEHLGGLAMVRRQAFSNDQWDVTGAQLMTIVKRDAPAFAVDPSQLVLGAPCPIEYSKTLDWSLANLPRAAFDYVWLVDPPQYDARLTKGMTPVWRAGNDVLLRVDR